MGSHDLRVGQYGAHLFKEGWAQLLVFSGGYGNLTRSLWQVSEAEMFAQEAVKLGIPDEKLLLETRSTNTGENIIFARRLLREKGLDPKSFLLVHKPYMERRALATFQKAWPKKQARVTSPPISFKDYPTTEIPLEKIINIMVGDFQRILNYPEKGFQVPQIVPNAVMQAYNFLIGSSFNRHLIKGGPST